MCRSQTCPVGDSFPFACGSCLSFSSSLQRTFTQAQNACSIFNGGILATAETEQELVALRNYGGAMGATFWIGYQYSTGTLVLSSDMVTAAPTFVSSAISGGAAPADGVCVAINADGSLERIVCSEERGYACLFNLTGILYILQVYSAWCAFVLWLCACSSSPSLITHPLTHTHISLHTCCSSSHTPHTRT